MPKDYREYDEDEEYNEADDQRAETTDDIFDEHGNIRDDLDLSDKSDLDDEPVADDIFDEHGNIRDDLDLVDKSDLDDETIVDDIFDEHGNIRDDLDLSDDNDRSDLSPYVLENVDVYTVKDPHFVKSLSDFNDLEFYKQMLHDGKGVQSLYDADPDARLESYWIEFDAQHDTNYTKTFRIFYSDDPIKISEKDGVYEASNGEHRIWLARQLGIRYLPAQVRHYPDSK